MKLKNKEIKKILCPITISETAPKLFRKTAFIAKGFNAEVHLLHVVRDINNPENTRFKFTTVISDNIEKAGKEMLADFSAPFISIFPNGCRLAVKKGIASEEIIKYVTSERIDLVVMGTHGRRKLNEIVFGSVANRVVKRCPVPVVTVNPYKV